MLSHTILVLLLSTASRPDSPPEQRQPSRPPRATASLYAYRYAKNIRYPMNAQRLQERHFRSTNHRNATLLMAIRRYLKVNSCQPIAEKPIDIRLLVREDRPDGPVYLCLGKNNIISLHDTAYVLNNAMRKLVRHRLPLGRRTYYAPLLDE